MRVDGTTVNSSETPKVHNVSILDGSGSMGGSKYRNACEGIRLDFETCKKESFESFTFVEFNNYNDITTHCFMKLLSKVELRFNEAQGNTPLYQTIGETLEKLLKEVPKEDKVLVKIFTDGGENASQGKYSDPHILKTMIANCKLRGFTITFVGTNFDVDFIIKTLNIESTNTLVHDNTGEGVRMAFVAQAGATVQYRKSLNKGEDVSKGFYSKVLND